MEHTHIVKAFDRELAQIENLILEMGGMVESQISRSIDALIARDEAEAAIIRKADKAIDAKEQEVDELALKVLGLRQPMAQDLRSVVCALKVSSNLERVGDYAKNIAKRTITIGEIPALGTAEKTIRRMGQLVQEMVRDVLNAYVNKDLAMADELILRDEEVDHMHNTLFRELLTYMMEDPRHITQCMHLLFIAKNLERMGDHTTAVAEQIHYVVTGSIPEDSRPKSDKTSEMNIESDLDD